MARKSDHQLVVGCARSDTQSPSAAWSGSACIDVVLVGSGHIALEEVVAAALAGSACMVVFLVGSGHIVLEEVVAAALPGWCSFGCS